MSVSWAPPNTVELPATPGRERVLSCGCVLVECAPRGVTEGGEFLTGRETVLVACPLVFEHHALVREAAVEVGADDLDALAERCEQFLTGARA